MKLASFIGGQSSRLRPQYISTNEAVVYDNIDNSRGTLLPEKNKVATDIESDKFSVFFEGAWVSSDTYLSSVEFQKKLYTADGIKPMEFDGTDSVNLGIARPTVEPTIVTIVSEEGVDGVATYVYTFYSSTTGLESAPSPVSRDLASQGTIIVTDMEVSTDSKVDKKRIYRVDGDITLFSLVDTIDNTETEFTDNIPPTLIDSRILPSIGDAPAPDELNHIAESYAMLFGAEGSKLRYTPIGRPHSWPEVYFLQFNSDITGIRAVANGLLVMTLKQTHLVLGSTPTGLSQQLIDGSQGCLGSHTIRQLGSGLLWVSEDGVCSSNGGKVTVISRDKLGPLSLDPVISSVHDDVYYLVMEDYILAMDTRYEGIFKTFTLDVETVFAGDDKLYGWKDDTVYELFVSDEPLEFYYLSPRFPEGTVTTYKTYKKVYIYYKGDIIINILIDDVSVTTFTLEGEGSQELQIPHISQRGHFIQLDIKGTGEVYEIDIVANTSASHG